MSPISEAERCVLKAEEAGIRGPSIDEIIASKKVMGKVATE